MEESDCNEEDIENMMVKVFGEYQSHHSCYEDKDKNNSD